MRSRCLGVSTSKCVSFYDRSHEVSKHMLQIVLSDETMAMMSESLKSNSPCDKPEVGDARTPGYNEAFDQESRFLDIIAIKRKS